MTLGGGRVQAYDSSDSQFQRSKKSVARRGQVAASASQGIAAAIMRAVVGDIVLDDVLARREQINKDLRRTHKSSRPRATAKPWRPFMPRRSLSMVRR